MNICQDFPLRLSVCIESLKGFSCSENTNLNVAFVKNKYWNTQSSSTSKSNRSFIAELAIWHAQKENLQKLDEVLVTAHSCPPEENVFETSWNSCIFIHSKREVQGNFTLFSYTSSSTLYSCQWLSQSVGRVQTSVAWSLRACYISVSVLPSPHAFSLWYLTFKTRCTTYMFDKYCAMCIISLDP